MLFRCDLLPFPPCWESCRMLSVGSPIVYGLGLSRRRGGGAICSCWAYIGTRHHLPRSSIFPEVQPSKILTKAPPRSVVVGNMLALQKPRARSFALRPQSPEYRRRVRSKTPPQLIVTAAAESLLGTVRPSQRHTVGAWKLKAFRPPGHRGPNLGRLP